MRAGSHSKATARCNNNNSTTRPAAGTNRNSSTNCHTPLNCPPWNTHQSAVVHNRLLPLVCAFDPLEAGPFEQLLQHLVLHVGAALMSKVTRHVLRVWRALRRLWQNSCKLQTTHSATLRVRTQSNTVISSTHAATHSVTQSTIQPSNYLVHSSNIQGEGAA